MRSTTTFLIAPLAALAIAGAGVAPAQAHGDEHTGHHTGHSGGHSDRSAEIVTSEETGAALEQAGVTLDAVDPATAEEQGDGQTELTFPQDDGSEQRASTGGSNSDHEVAFDGGIAYSSGPSSSVTSWDDPTIDTSDGTVSFDVGGQRADLLQVVPDEDSDKQGDENARTGFEQGDHSEHSEHGDGCDEYDLALTTEGADALNEVTGDDTFSEGQVFADIDGAKAH